MDSAIISVNVVSGVQLPGTAAPSVTVNSSVSQGPTINATISAGARGPQGDPGTPGTNGVDGVDGADGAPGVGVPVGGTTGQVLAKNSNTNYDTEWVDPASSTTVDVVSNVATARILGRVATGSGDSEELTATQVRTLINVEDGADVTDATNVAAAGAFMKSVDDTDDITEGATKKFATAAEKTKLSYISVTQAVDLDTIEADTATNNAKVSNATHTGDVTGSTALTIANDAVSNAKLANMAVNTIKGRITSGTGDPEDLTAANIRTIINVADGATANDTDANLKNRANHTGTQLASTISDLQESVEDIIGSKVVAGSNITVTYNDSTGQTTIDSAGGGVTTLAGLTDVNVTGALDGEVLTYSSGSSNWISSPVTASVPDILFLNILN